MIETMRTSAPVLALLSCVSLAIGCSDSRARDESRSIATDPSLTERYAELIQKGESQLTSGDLSGALASFQEAASEALVEVPNYEVLVRVADVQCRKGDKGLGSSTLADFRCALDVDAGKTACFLDRDAAQANPKLSVGCFERMCGELYLSYYENPTKQQLKRIAQLRSQADGVEKACSAEAK